MRKPEYLSNSALQLFETDRREYYLRYLCETRSPKIAQTRPMAVGSSFDGLVKNAIEKMCGMPIVDYSSQIEAKDGTPERAQAIADGAEVMDFYRSAGGISRLLVSGVPRMEFSVKGPLQGTESCVGGPVILLGKPDLYYSACGYSCINDWKVNGFCSSASPAPGYVWCSKTKSHHKDIFPKVLKSSSGCQMPLNGSADRFLWHDQLAAYGWLLGEDVGSQFLLQVHQVTRDSKGLRLSEHRVLADKGRQEALRDRYAGAWETIHNGRCFTDLSFEEDILEQRRLDITALGLQDPVFNMCVGR